MADIKRHTSPVIAIDGPSGSGKGTIAALLAQDLGWHFLDSGALYRVLAYGVEKNQLWDVDVGAWARLAASLPVSFEFVGGQSQACYQNNNIEAQIRTEQMGAQASRVALVAEVRQALLKLQHDFAKAPGLVADGRDMGTVVFPHAPLKIFLTASAEVRAQRRYLQLKEQGENVSLAALLADIKKRDEQDSQRSAAPLAVAHDAIELDSSSLSIAEVLNIIRKKAKLRSLI